MNRTLARVLEVATVLAVAALLLWLPFDWFRALFVVLGAVALVRLIDAYTR